MNVWTYFLLALLLALFLKRLLLPSSHLLH